MGTCCGKIEKNPAENKSFPEASDEAKPLRPMRDAEVRRRKINKEATPSDNTEEITVDNKKVLEEAGNKTETKTSSLNNLETKEDDTSKIEQISKSIQNVELGEVKDALINGTNDAAPSPNEQKNCTETRLTSIVPEPEEMLRNTISEEQPDQPKETNSTDKTDAPEHTSSSSIQSSEEKTGSSENDHVMQETVFPLDLSLGEKENLQVEGINVEAITHVEDFDKAHKSDKETNQATFEQASDLTTDTESDLKALLTPDVLKKLNEENNINDSQEQKNSTKETEQTEKLDEALAIFPPSLSSVEKSNLEEEAKDFDQADKVATSNEKNAETITHSAKIESDLGALLTPNLLKKLHEEQQNQERSNEKQTATLLGSATEASDRPASSSAIRLSQQEQRQSRNSFLGNFLQEGVFSSFDEQFNSMTSSEDPAKKIEAIAKSIRNLQRQVETFSGGKTSTEYLYLESSLLINIDELNKIESGDDSTKKADALSHIYELLKKLDENSVF